MAAKLKKLSWVIFSEVKRKEPPVSTGNKNNEKKQLRNKNKQKENKIK